VQLVPHVRAAAFASDGAALAVAARRLVQVRALDAGATSFGFRVTSPVRALAIAGHGARVGVATLDGRIVVRGRRGETVVRAPSVQTAVALDADGRVLAGAAGRRVTVWRDGRHAVSIDTGSDVADVALAPDGSVVATAGTDGAVRVWNVPAGTLATIAITPAQLTRVAFNRDGTALATGGTDGVTRVFARSGRPVAVLARHAEAVSALAFSPTSRLAVTGSRLGGARIWDPGIAPDLRVVARPPGCCSAFAAQPGATAVGTQTATLLLRDGRPEVTYPTGPVTALAVDGGTLLTGEHGGRVLRWSSPGARRTLVSFGEPVSAIAARGATVAASSRDGRVVVRSAGRTLRFREAAAVAGLAISPDGLRLATADADDTARVHDLRTGRVLLVLRGHTKPVTAVAFSPDGTKIATSSFDHDVRLWDAASGHPEQVLRAQFAVVRDVAFSPDGRWVVSSGPTTAALFRSDTGERLAYLRGPAAALVGAAFVSARRVIAASLDGTVRSYRCGVCGGLDELLRLADARIHATGGRLTAAERRSLVR
jgi:WD40 repeat protein